MPLTDLLRVWILTTAFGLTSTLAGAEVSPPNIVVFYTDDHGHADLSCQGVLQDIKTPNVDRLARDGVLARHGYSTAPQCVPSRAGLMTGKFQSRFGLESNGSSLDGFNRELTIAERLQDVGYVTAQFGKWHLGPTEKIVDHGFKHVFAQNAGRPFSANISLDGKDRPMSNLKPEMYHVDGCSRAAASVIERYKDKPLFLYIAYRAPHVPLDAPQKYLDRFPGKMPQRRRQALAMLSAVDDGVGLVTRTLAKHDLTDRTLIFYIGDNGAPLKIHKYDAPGGGPGWDGSLNDPLNGEKGMLAEGGMHVPFVVSWPGTISPGRVYDHPISALDVAATAASLAGITVNDGELDGVNLIPHLTGETEAAPHDALMWRWVAQSAIREGKWKLLRGGNREYLYDLDADLEEKHNLATTHPELATRLRTRLTKWTAELDPPGLAEKPMSTVWSDYFDFYLEGKPPTPLREKFTTKDGSGELPRQWVGRNGTLKVVDGALQLAASSRSRGQAPFMARSGLKLKGPIVASIRLRCQSDGTAGFAWRTEKDKDFVAGKRVSFDVSRTSEATNHHVKIPADGVLIHLRLLLPGGTSSIENLTLQGADGKTLTLWD